MNQKTAKLIARYCRAINRNRHQAKETWRKLPWTARAAVRQQLKAFLTKVSIKN